jgi:FixJ family two-component response regulator
MRSKRILLVDDEKNIRLTLARSLQPLGLETESAVNGEEALAQLQRKEFGLMLLDLKMPGMDGMEVLRRVSETRPDIRVIIITAHGTVESAVEAMKLGAVDFIQKPFTPEKILELVARVLAREELDEEKASDYESRLELAKRSIADRHIGAALEHLRKAIGIDFERPEAYNLMGAILEIQGDRREAQRQYRIALEHDPTYKPARENLERTATRRRRLGKKITLGNAGASSKKDR